MENHASACVGKIMAVIHPHARVISSESNLIDLSRRNVEGINPPGTPHDRVAVTAKYEHMMTVQMHRMIHITAIHKRCFYQVSFMNHQHGNIRENLSVDRPHGLEITIIESQFAIEYERKFPVKVA